MKYPKPVSIAHIKNLGKFFIDGDVVKWKLSSPAGWNSAWFNPYGK